MRVRDVMTRDVESARPDQTLQQVARMMADGDFGVAPVCDGDRLLGIVTDRDIAVRGVATGKSLDTPVRDVMSGDVKTVRDDDKVADVYRTMSQAQVRRAPVVDESGRLCGIVALADLARRNDDREVGETLQDISKT